MQNKSKGFAVYTQLENVDGKIIQLVHVLIFELICKLDNMGTQIRHYLSSISVPCEYLNLVTMKFERDAISIQNWKGKERILHLHFCDKNQCSLQMWQKRQSIEQHLIGNKNLNVLLHAFVAAKLS